MLERPVTSRAHFGLLQARGMEAQSAGRLYPHVCALVDILAPLFLWVYPVGELLGDPSAAAVMFLLVVKFCRDRNAISNKCFQ